MCLAERSVYFGEGYDMALYEVNVVSGSFLAISKSGKFNKYKLIVR